MAYELWTIRQVERAWFNKDYSEISEDLFKIIYTEFVDTTGGYIGAHFDKLSYIKLLENRINTVNKFITLQILFVEEFGVAYQKSFEIVKQYGYSVKWAGDKDRFLQQLEDIKVQESYTNSDLQISIKEFEELENSEKQPEQTLKQKRENWMNCVNSLIKIGYPIDKDKMMFEEISFIIKYEKDQSLKNGR